MEGEREEGIDRGLMDGGMERGIDGWKERGRDRWIEGENDVQTHSVAVSFALAS